MDRKRLGYLGLILGTMIGTGIASFAPKPKEHNAIEWLDGPRVVRNFDFVSDTGDFTRQSLMGRWTIVALGFVHCPEICPINLSELAKLASHLSAQVIDPPVSFVFVSVDPGRDSPIRIGQYARSFHSSILGVTGTAAQLNQFADDLGLRFARSSGFDDDSASHSVTFSIIGPDGTLRGRFDPGFLVSNLIEELTLEIVPARIPSS